MRKSTQTVWLVIAAVGALAVQSAFAQDAKTTSAPKQQDVAAVLKTSENILGMIRGVNRIDALNTLEFWGTGTMNALGQAYKPGGNWPAFKVTDYHVSISYAVPAMRVDITRTNPDGTVQGGGGLPLAAPQRQIQVVSGKFAWNETVPGAGFLPNSTATPAPDAVNDRLLQLWITPFGALKAATAAGADAKMTTEYGLTVITFPAAGTTVKMTLNAKKLVEKVETRSDNPVLGDIVTETAYSDYADLGELKSDVMFPAHIVQTQGGFPVLDITITKDDADNPYLVFPVPDVVKKAPGPAPVKVDTAKVADGVYYLTGGTHHSVAVEFKNYVALVECPLNDERSLAVIDAVKKAIPNKPIKYVINTHHHFDHAGGLRACVAEGSTVITQAENVPYYQKTWGMPHTIKPDKETQARKKSVFEAVAEKRVLTDGTQTLELYHLQGSNHADSMLIGYLPKAKILIEADSYNPAAANAPPGPVVKESVNLVDQIKKLNLDVQQITPLHGRLVTITDLRKAVGETAGN